MKIICIGRNYRPHIEELGNDPAKVSEPVFFIKPDTALLRNNDPFYIPDFSQEVDYECELVVRIDRLGKCIDRRFAHRYYNEVGLGIDFTARDLQRRAVAEGLPWTTAKCFDHSAAVSLQFVPLAELGDINNLRFELSVDGEVRQQASTAEMIFGIDEIIEYVSKFTTLRMGDLIFTGTPKGVGAVHKGNNLRGVLEGRVLLDFDIR